MDFGTIMGAKPIILLFLVPFLASVGASARADTPATVVAISSIEPAPPMLAAPTVDAAFLMLRSVFSDPRAQGIPYSAVVMSYDAAMADIGSFSASFGDWGRTHSVLYQQQLIAMMVTRHWDNDQNNEGWGAEGGVWQYAKVMTRAPGSTDAMVLTIDFRKMPDGTYRMWPPEREKERQRHLESANPS